MANDCLVTKLKAVVNNDNLDKLGSIRIFVTPNFSNNEYYINVNLGSKPHRISILGNTNTATSVSPSRLGTLVDGHTIDYLGTEYPTDGFKITLQSGDLTTITIDGKYDLEGITFTDSKSFRFRNGIKDVPLNIKRLAINHYDDALFTSDFVNFSNLTSVIFFNTFSSFEGKLSDFSALTALKTIRANKNTNTITGNIKDIGGLTELTTFNFVGNTTITGSLEEFVAAQRTAGRTTESTGINFDYGIANVTFNGTSMLRSHACTLTWTADTITYDGVTISA